MRFALLIPLALACACSGPSGAVRLMPHAGDGPRVLCVTAHPDDEIAFGGTAFKTSSHLGGRVDLVVITNGEAGYKYSTLAESLYRRRLTDPVVGRIDLPTIRRAELIEGCGYLGMHSILFLDQTDNRYTLDPNEVIGEEGVWNVTTVEATLDRVLAEGDYDFVLTHLPVPRTHGHHKAASILALRAVARMPESERPTVLGSFGISKTRPTPPLELEGYPETRRTRTSFHFDRSQKFGYRNRLDYRIVVRWAMTAHKSQGTMQTFSPGEKENYYLYEVSPEGSEEAARRWFERLREPQFGALDYDESGRLKTVQPQVLGEGKP